MAAKAFSSNLFACVIQQGMHTSYYLWLYPALALLQIDEEKEAKKMAAARAVLAGRSFTEQDNDPFEGLGPQEIQAYIDKALEGVSQTDPFEVCLHPYLVPFNVLNLNLC